MLGHWEQVSNCNRPSELSWCIICVEDFVLHCDCLAGSDFKYVNGSSLKLRELFSEIIPLPDNHKHLLGAGPDSHSINASFLISHSVVPSRCLTHIRFRTLSGSYEDMRSKISGARVATKHPVRIGCTGGLFKEMLARIICSCQLAGKSHHPAFRGRRMSVSGKNSISNWMVVFVSYSVDCISQSVYKIKHSYLGIQLERYS